MRKIGAILHNYSDYTIFYVLFCMIIRLLWLLQHWGGDAAFVNKTAENQNIIIG